MTERNPYQRDIDWFNEVFKSGRRAGHEDVCLEILKHDPSFAWQIAREFLATANGEQANTAKE